MINKLLHGSTTNLKKIVMSFEMERLQTLKMQEILISNPIMKSCLVGTFPFKKKIISFNISPFKTSAFFTWRLAKISKIC